MESETLERRARGRLGHSPRITHLSWGSVEVEGDRHFKDVKCFPGGCREWDWKETGTSHLPGIQPEDVEDLIDSGAKVIVLSKGMNNRLHVCPETLELLERRSVGARLLHTEEAVRVYNQLAKTEQVAGLFHSTC